MLQEFINQNLIDMKDEKNLTMLKKACNDVVKNLKKNKSKVQRFTLMALDPNISARNSEVIEIKNIIIKRWSTFPSFYKDTPLTFIRAVILEALQELSKDINFACLIWFSGRNVIKYYKLGREKKILLDFLSELGNQVNNEAIDRWSLSENPENLETNYEELEIKENIIDKTALQKKLEDASGPKNESGSSNFESPNPHWPNEGQTWSFQFAPRAAQSISDIINKVFKKQALELAQFIKQIQELLNIKIIDVQSEILQKNNLSHIRTYLLWWKEACYSNTVKQSYRNLQNCLLQIIVAYDYAILVPPIYPESVDFFLRETHRKLISTEDPEIKISEILNLINKSKQELKTVFDYYEEEKGRVSLFNFIKGYIWDNYTVDKFNEMVGISRLTKISLSDFTVWLFHDIQAQKIIKSGLSYVGKV
jgi:hypothetical protein